MSTLMRSRPLRALLTPIAAATLAIAAQAQTFGPALNLSNSAGASGSGRIAVAAADVYVAWAETSTPKKQIVRFVRSSDGGASFGSPVTVLSAGIGCCGPHVAADGAYVYVARTSEPGINKPTKVYLRASANHGMSFGSEIQVPNAGWLHAIDAAGSNVHLLWSGAGGLFVSTSANGGASFAPAVAVSGGAGGAGGVMRALGSNVHVVWQGDGTVPGRAEVFYSRSLDGGASFGTPANLSNTAGQNSVMPQLALAGTNVYVAYREGGPNEHRLARSTDGGASFIAPVGLISGFADQHGQAGGPQLAASGAVLHVVWYDDPGTAGDYHLFHRSSVDGGDNFGATTDLSPVPQPAHIGPGRVAAEGSNAYVAWSLGNEVWIRRSVDSGASFAAAVNVSASDGASGDAFILAIPAGVHVGWSDNTPGNHEILYRFGTTP